MWDEFKESFCDDLLYSLEHNPVSFPLPLVDPHLDYGLFLIQTALTERDQKLTEHSLPACIFDWSRVDKAIHSDEFDEALEQLLSIELRAQLNADQSTCFNSIITGIENDPQTAHFYLQGPGGTGKTFLYKAICHYYRGMGKTVLCVASTGIAALLLPNGRTSHTQFKIPINLHEDSACPVSRNCRLARVLRSANLIIWDEVPMQDKLCFEAVHRLFVDLLRTDDSILFAGVPVKVTTK